MRQPKCFCRSLVCLWGWTPKCYLQHSVPIVFCCQQRRKEDFLNLKKKSNQKVQRKCWLSCCRVLFSCSCWEALTSRKTLDQSFLGWAVSLFTAARERQLLTSLSFHCSGGTVLRWCIFLVSALRKNRQEEQGFQGIHGHTGAPGQHVHMVRIHHRHEKKKRQGRGGGRVRGRGTEVDYSTLLFSTLASKTSIKYQNHL